MPVPPVPSPLPKPAVRTWRAGTPIYRLDLEAPTLSIMRITLLKQVLAPVTPTKDLRLAALTDSEIKRLRVTHGQLIDADAEEYPATAAWGQAIYDHPARFDGIVWNSRQHVATLSVMLWSTRAGAVSAGASVAPEPLFVGPGYDRVVALANAMDVVVVDRRRLALERAIGLGAGAFGHESSTSRAWRTGWPARRVSASSTS